MNRKENKVTDSQSGIGFGTGIGLKYTYNKAGIFINPFLNVHALIPFHKEKYQQHLVEGGIKFGVYYNF